VSFKPRNAVRFLGVPSPQIPQLPRFPSLPDVPFLVLRVSAVRTFDGLLKTAYRNTALSTTGMPSVNIAIDASWALRLPAPQTPFSPASRSMPTGTPPALRRPESDSRSDLSLARNGHASPRFHSGVKFPVLTLRIPTCFFPARSALQLRNLDRFAPGATASTPQARCRISTNRYRPSRTPPLPFWAFYRPSGSVLLLGLHFATNSLCQGIFT
jgi:hypothetical protein